MQMNSRFHDPAVFTHEKTTVDIYVIGGSVVLSGRSVVVHSDRGSVVLSDKGQCGTQR
jgi:hypothetical protein